MVNIHAYNASAFDHLYVYDDYGLQAYLQQKLLLKQCTYYIIPFTINCMLLFV